jgi:GAF domain-containing protein
MFTRMLELALMELMEHVATQLTIAITNAILQDAAGQRVSQGVLSAMNVLVD